MGEAVKSAGTNGDIASLIRYFALIGNGLLVHGRPEEALRYFNRALLLAWVTPDVGTPIMTHTGKAKALLELSRTTEARTILEEALVEARLEKRRGNEAELLLELARLAVALQNRSEAIAHLEKAVELASSGNLHRVLALAMFDLSKIYRESGELDKAEERAAVGIRASKRIGDIYSLPDQLAVLADLKASRGNFGEADRLYEEATDVIEAMLVNAASPGLKSSLVGAMGQIFLQHFTLLIQELEDPDRAFELLERARGRTAVDLLALRPEEFAESDFLSSGVQREISELQVRLLRAESPAERNQLLDQLFEVEQYLAPLFAVEFRSRGSAPRKVVGRDSLQDVLGQDELILEYVLDDPVSFCLAISGDQLWVVSLPARAQIEDSVDRYLAEIRSRRSGFEEARKLYSMLVEPIPEYDAKFRLIVVPDGKLHLLPFESLVRPDNEFLVRTQIITYAPSATMLHLLRSAPRRVAPSLPLLAVGNVPYGEPLRVMAMGSSNSRGSQERGGVRGVYDLDGANFTPLPWTAEEVRSVAEVAGPKSVVLTGENASGCLSHRWKTSL